MDEDLKQLSTLYFQEAVGASLAALVAPIPGDTDVGPLLNQDQLFRDIRRFRKSEDPNLPRRDWEEEPRKANWSQVGELTLAGICQQSKDLRLAGWLLEARIHLDGFAALAPGLVLIGLLEQEYGARMHPIFSSDEMGHRIAWYEWLDERIAESCQLQCLSGDGSLGFSWSDWEQAHHNEQLIEQAVAGVDHDTPTPRVSEIVDSFSRTPTRSLQHRLASLELAGCAMDFLLETLKETPLSDAVSLRNLWKVAEQMAGLLGSELERRGAMEYDQDDFGEDEHDGDGASGRAGIGEYTEFSDQPNGRESAYRQLEEAARYLAQIEPHSPVPYLVAKAVEWGNLNAAELYDELFVKRGGTLEVADVMNLGSERQPDA